MTSKFARWADLAGIAFVVLFVVGVNMTFGPQPDFKKHDSPTVVASKVFDSYSTGGKRALMIVGAYVLVLSALALIWFVFGLRARMVAAGSPPGGGPGLVFGFAVVGASVIVVSALALAAVAGSYTFGNEPLPTNADSIRVINDFGTGILLVGFGLASAAIIAVVTAAAWRSALLPRWLTYAGILGVLGGILAVAFLPLALVALWFLAVAITGLMRPRTTNAPVLTGVSTEMASNTEIAANT
jgi:hypothetical protein